MQHLYFAYATYVAYATCVLRICNIFRICNTFLQEVIFFKKCPMKYFLMVGSLLLHLMTVQYKRETYSYPKIVLAVPKMHRALFTPAHTQTITTAASNFHSYWFKLFGWTDGLIDWQVEKTFYSFYFVSATKQGRIHGSSVADGWTGAVMPKYACNSKIFRTYQRTDGPTRQGVESRVCNWKDE